MSYWKIKYDPCIDLQDAELASLCAKIDTLKDALSQMPLTIQLHDELNRIQIIHQVRGTTGIEGNVLSEEAVKEVLVERQPKTEQERETLNAYNALKFVKENGTESCTFCVSEEMIKTLHKLLTDGLTHNDNIAGQYRLHKITVGRNFEGEKFENISIQMKAFLKYINSDDVIKMGELIRAVLAHFYLVTIHPFSDGNGRTARMLEDCILYNSNYNIAGFFSLSNFYYRNRDEYFAQLDQARFKYNGNLHEFVKFSLNGFYSELQLSFKRIIQEYSRICFISMIQEMYQNKKITERQFALLNIMIKFNVSIDEVLALKKTDTIIKTIYTNIKSERTIRRDIDRLKTTKLLRSENKMLYVNFDYMKHYIGVKPDYLFERERYKSKTEPD